MAVVKANYVKRGKGERVTAKANIRYIQERPGRDKEKLTRPLFDSAGLIGRHEAYQFIDAEAKKGSFFYRFKLSPDPAKEDTKRDLHMQKLTRSMMQRLEKRLKTTIPWAGALHDDHTDKRHVHILAAIPRRLQRYELETLIKEATTICREQRRDLDRTADRQVSGLERTNRRDAARHTATYQPVKIGKRLHLAADRQAQKPPLILGRASAAKVPASCTCPRCHFPQSHDGHGVHSCVSCGRILHKKRELALQRKGREWERSL
jgi:hypothetical protein